MVCDKRDVLGTPLGFAIQGLGMVSVNVHIRMEGFPQDLDELFKWLLMHLGPLPPSRAVYLSDA